MRHLLVDISFHGFGHLSQTAPALNALRRLVPDLHLTVRSAVPFELLVSHIEGEFTHIQRATDFGMVMHSALTVDVERSAAAYLEFHRDWPVKLAHEVDELKRLEPDLVFADVSYLALAAAQRANIPALALCSLNWADIYAPLCAGQPHAEEIISQMREAYASAAQFLKPQPAMPMPDLANGRTIGPIARTGKQRRAELKNRLGLTPNEKLVLISMGGVDSRINMDGWPRLPGVRWLVQASWQTQHPDAFDLDKLDMPFIDLMPSCDAMVAKPGYGTFVEAACNGTPLLYVRRDAWPEEAFLVDWLQANGRCLEVERQALLRGDVGDSLTALLAQPAPTPVVATGVDEAAAILAGFLR